MHNSKEKIVFVWAECNFMLRVCVSRTNKQLQLSFSNALFSRCTAQSPEFLYRSTTFAISHLSIYILRVCIKYYIISLCTLTTCSSFGFVNILLTSIVYLHIRRNKQTARKKCARFPLIRPHSLCDCSPIFQALTLYSKHWTLCVVARCELCVCLPCSRFNTTHLFVNAQNSDRLSVENSGLGETRREALCLYLSVWGSTR